MIEKDGTIMTLLEHANLTCEMLVQDYIENNKCTIYSFWDVMKIIKHSYELTAISKPDAERYCYHMHITFDEMMTADN